MSAVLTTRATPTTPTTRRVAAAMIAIAASLAVASAIHLFGNVQGRNDLYDASDAGMAEAIIGLVVLAGGVRLWRAGRRGRSAGLLALGFAVVGFLVGITITARAGHAPDIGYHAVVLPTLIACFVALVRPSADR